MRQSICVVDPVCERLTCTLSFFGNCFTFIYAWFVLLLFFFFARTVLETFLESVISPIGNV